MDKRDFLELLKKHDAGKIDNDIFEKYAIMMFLFSWFEELVFTEKKQKEFKTLKKVCKDLSSLLNLEYDTLLQHFQKKYISGEEKTKAFDEIYHEKNKMDEKEHIAAVLSGTLSSDYDKLLTAFQISYIYRNRTFHGSKYLSNFASYSKEIDIINEFMFSIIKCCLHKNYHGYKELHQ